MVFIVIDQAAVGNDLAFLPRQRVQPQGNARHAAVRLDYIGGKLRHASQHGAAQAWNEYPVAQGKGRGIIRQQRRHAPVDAVGAVTLGGIFARQIGAAAQHALAAGRLLAGGAVAGLVGKNGRADVGLLRADGITGDGQGTVNRGHLAGQGSGGAGSIQRLDGLGGGHIAWVLAGEGELRQAQRVGAEGGGFAGGNQFIGGGDGVGDIADHFDQQIPGQSLMLGPNLRAVSGSAWPQPS